VSPLAAPKPPSQLTTSVSLHWSPEPLRSHPAASTCASWMAELALDDAIHLGSNQFARAPGPAAFAIGAATIAAATISAARVRDSVSILEFLARARTTFFLREKNYSGLFVKHTSIGPFLFLAWQCQVLALEHFHMYLHSKNKFMYRVNSFCKFLPKRHLKYKFMYVPCKYLIYLYYLLIL
jgi:hypothetical protein